MLQFPEEYFEDEVRDGFYVPSMIKELGQLNLMCLMRLTEYAENIT